MIFCTKRASVLGKKEIVILLQITTYIPIVIGKKKS